MRLCSLFLLLFTISPGVSQTTTIDSLKSGISESTDSAKTKLFLSIAKEYRFSNYDSVVLYGNKAIDFAIELDDKEMIIESLIELAYINISIGNRQKSLIYYNRAKKACIDEGNNFLLAKIYLDLERYYVTLSDYANGLSSLETAFKIISKNNLNSLKPDLYINYGNLYIILQDFSVAKYYAKLAINSSKTANNNSSLIRSTLLLGKIHYHNKVYDSSFYYYNRALILAKRANNKLLLQKIHRSISASYIKNLEYYKANLYIDSSIMYCNELGLRNEVSSLYAFKAHIASIKGDFKSTLTYNKQAYELRRNIGHRISICASLLNIGGNFSELGVFDSAHYYLNRGIRIADEQKALIYLVYGYGKFAKLYKAEGNYERALYYTELRNSLSDSLTTQKTNEKVRFFKSQFELEKEKTLTEKIKLKKKNNESIFFFITAVLSIGIIILMSVLYFLKRKSTKEIEKAKEKAEESDRLKSAFLANMSHEIRTPMNGILGFAELLKESQLTGEQQQEYISIIEKSGIRMLNIINDIVSISKIESGLISVSLQESNINDQLDYIHKFFKPEVQGKGIQFSINKSLPASGASIITDREKLFAILSNLIKNAVKFTEKGSIEVGYKLKKSGGGLDVEFYVQDTGIGLPKDRQEAIFERFIQADMSGADAHQGAGLGLSISKAYVEMLGGKIWVESQEGKGSTFYFSLPYHTEEKDSKPDGHESMDVTDFKPDSKLSTLIVEDDDTSIMLIKLAIKSFSREIIHVRSGTEAVAACLNNPDIDLVLMDIQIPELDGYEATRQIREFNKNVIIIAQTAFALSGDKEKAIAAGCNDYIPKPIYKEKLLQLIAKYY